MKHSGGWWKLWWMTLVAIGLAACGGGGSGDSGEASALALSAPRVTIADSAVVGDTVMLDASQNTLPAGAAISYFWVVTAPDGTKRSVGTPTNAVASFNADAIGKYSAALTVAVSVSGKAYGSPPTIVDVTVRPRMARPTAQIRALARAQALAGAPLALPDKSSPVLTRGAAGAESQLAASQPIDWGSGRFSYSGDLRVAGPVYPDYLFGSNQAVSYSATVKSGNFLSIEFTTDAQAFEVQQKGLGYNSRMRVVVDGRLANETPIEYPNDGEFYLTKVAFSSKASRRIRLLMNTPYFGGIRIGAGDSVSKPATTNVLRTMFMGDSITEGPAGQAGAITSYAPLVADRLGWADSWVSGVGSTGYLAAPSPKLTLRQRFKTDVTPYGPDILVIAAGINDTQFTDAQIEAEARLLFDQVQADLPTSLIFVAGPWGSSTQMRPGIAAALKAAIGNRPNFYWIPNADDGWITGSGNAGRPAGDGNADLYISSDTTHPTVAGIDYIAGRLSAWMKDVLTR